MYRINGFDVKIFTSLKIVISWTSVSQQERMTKFFFSKDKQKKSLTKVTKEKPTMAKFMHSAQDFIQVKLHSVNFENVGERKNNL